MVWLRPIEYTLSPQRAMLRGICSRGRTIAMPPCQIAGFNVTAGCTGTYGNIPQGQFDVAPILHLPDQVLNHIVVEGEGKCLQREGVCRLDRALQVEAGVGYAQNHGCGGG